MGIFNKIYARAIRCENCQRQMKKLNRPITKLSETGLEFSHLTREQLLSGETRANQCRTCHRVWCDDCFMKQVRYVNCVCGHKLECNRIAVRFVDKTALPGTSHCEICGRPLQKLETGEGYIMLTQEQALIGYGPAEECQECSRIYCSNCYPKRPNICTCGKRALRLIKARYSDM